MRQIQIGLTSLLCIAVFCTASGQVSETNLFLSVNRAVPDGPISGIEDIQTNSSQIVELTGVRVRLKIVGNFNGDLYAYLRHTSTSSSHLAVLLNRPGRSVTSSNGYSDAGFDVVLSDMAPSTTGSKHADAVRSFVLCDTALAMAEKVLVPGGHFVCKIFQGEDFKTFCDNVKARFDRMHIFKPQSSRKGSREIFIIGLGKV